MQPVFRRCYNSVMRRNRQLPPNIGSVIAIDGPVASGKSSVGRAVAARLDLRFLDTGVMYRAVTWLALHRGIPVADVNAVERLAQNCIMTVDYDSANSAAIIIDGHPLSQELTSADVDRSVSTVSAASGVRRAMVKQQRAIGAGGSIVMAGRDIASVVLPNADVKLYIDASVEERARRRWRQKTGDDSAADYRKVLADILRRDNLDRQRSDSPLVIAHGAVVINTDDMDFTETVGAVMSAVKAAIGTPARAAPKEA